MLNRTFKTLASIGIVALLLLNYLVTGCAGSHHESSIEVGVSTSTEPAPLSPKHLNVGFVVVDGVYNSELMAPYDIFHHTVFHRDSAMQVFTVAPTKRLIKSFEGLSLLPDYSFQDCPEIDILVLPSAEHSMNTDLENEQLIEFVKSRGEQAEFILSLCDGAFVLAKAGLLDDRQCTTFPGDIQAFRDMFPHLTVREGVSFVHHGKAITSAGGAVSYDPAMYLVEHLFGPMVAQNVGRGMVIDWEQEKTGIPAVVIP